MPAANDRKIVLVTRKTRLEDLIARYLTPAQARFYVEHLGADFSDYEREHEVYHAQRRTALQVLEQWGRYQVIERGLLPNFIFAPDDIVVALGQDGVVANTMKYLDGHPLIGVNPDPARHDGILLPFAPRDLAKLLPEVAADKRDSQAVTMAEARLSDGQVLHAVNDLFVGARTHVSAVYEIATGGMTERQSSSGLIVSTGLGSTAWFKSIVTGSLAIAGSFGPPSAPASYDALAWDAAELRFAVREPFPSRHSQTSLVCGRLAPMEQLRIRSLMGDNGVIFSDGIEADRLDFNAGAEVTIGIAARRGRLIV
ncbi:sugar kinase [Bradyrhizobium sacchari]|uniref:NAD kinase n=1 Tax=Bradyrhizobium sacchari TaxID=1399419 RepID=A0A560K5H8_9BRAD|nr:sugar kinase [Bradyrhizobium sacchari]OPY97510.1 sugar kinase [Bradyrhizobium sacchari]TWB54094.1 NAD kinase [Bradyrhizobium sacchari]TWB78542.1 NAD kinase [Bradyrhizobium sacchari]